MTKRVVLDPVADLAYTPVGHPCDMKWIGEQRA
jgi:hypothetical protein